VASDSERHPSLRNGGASAPTAEPNVGMEPEEAGPPRGEPVPGPRVEDGRIRTGKLAGLTMGRAIWVLSWPILIEAFLNSAVGLVDTMLAAGISEAAADAIGGASYVTWLLTIIGMAIGVGATALVSRSMGRGRQAFADTATSQSVLLAIGAGVVVGVLVFVLAPALATMLQLNEEASAKLVGYLRVVAFGVPMISVLTAGSACCRGAGDSLRPLLAFGGVNIGNILVSWIFSGVDIAVSKPQPDGTFVREVLIANPFGFDMGIIGIAIGTLVAWAIGGAIILQWLVRGSPGVTIKRRRLRPHPFTMRRLIRVGTPNFIETFGMWFGNFIVLLMVGWLVQPGLLGAHIVAVRVESLSFLPGFAMGMAAATLAGQYLGARREDLARKALFVCTLLASGLMGAFGVAFLTVPEFIVGLFTQQQAHLEITPTLIFIAGLVQVPFAIVMVLRTGMRGSGDTKVTMILTWVATYLIRIPLVYVLSGVDIPAPSWLPFVDGVIVNPSPFDYGLVGVWIGLTAELGIRALMFVGRFLHGGWSRVRV